MATTAGCILLYTLPDAIAAAMGRVMPIWFYEGQVGSCTQLHSLHTRSPAGSGQRPRRGPAPAAGMRGWPAVAAAAAAVAQGADA